MGTHRILQFLPLVAMCQGLAASSLGEASRSIRLHPEQRSAEPEGMAVVARVNGGKPVRLLVDTGAARILLSRRVAEKAGLQPGGLVRVFGVGDRGARMGRRAVAKSVVLDGFELRDIEVDIAEQEFPPGVDGLLGTAVFAGYIVRLDNPRCRLDLLPSANPAGAQSIAMRDPFLLVTTEVKGLGRGQFLVDTGAGFSAVDDEMAPDGGERQTPVGGIAGTAAARVLGGMEFVVDGKKLWDRNTYALNLAELSRRSGHRIAGLLGFSALRHSVLRIDYGRRSVTIENE